MNRCTFARIVVIAVLLAGVAIRFGPLQRDSFWLDEAYTVQVARSHTATQIWTDNPDPLHPPLFYIVVKAALHVFGVSETSARLPSALSSVLNLALVWILARCLRLRSTTAALAAVLLALAPVDVWYAREARMYEMVTTAALLFAIGLTVKARSGPVLAAAALAAGLYLDFTMVPLALALVGLWLVWWWYTGHEPQRLLPVVIGVALGCLACAPLWSRIDAVFHGLGGVTFFSRAARLAGTERLGATTALAMLVGLVIGLVVATAFIWRQAGRDGFRRWWGWLVPIAFIAGTAALAIPRGYSAKQILVTGWPFVVVLVAWTLLECQSRVAVSRPAAGLATPRVVAVVAVSAIAAVATFMTHRADWRGVVAYLNARVPASGVVWLDPSWDDVPYAYYGPKHHAVVDGLPSRLRCDGSAPRREVWFVAERYGATPPTSATEAWLDTHLPVLETVSFERLDVRRYNAAGCAD